MIVSIMQPAYLPWLGYFDRISRSDLHIVLDSVPLGHQNRTNFTARNRIRTSSGATWLTVPLQRGSDSVAINQVAIADIPTWSRKHWETLRHAYSKAAHWHTVESTLSACYSQQFSALAPLLQATTSPLLSQLGIVTPMVSASTLLVRGAKSDLILALCQAVGATTYLSGPFGRDYLNVETFSRANIEIEFHDYLHPTYLQGAAAEFIPYLSVVDLLAHHGADSAAIFASTPLVTRL